MECPHCDEDIDSVTRTGERRYACGACSMVIAFDDLNPHLDDLNVVDKRDKSRTVEKDDEDDNVSEDSSKDTNNNTEEADSAEEGVSEPTQKAGRSDRDIIREQGREGLKQIKEDKLKQWLATTDGVGSKTENRILMVFRNEDMYTEEPNTLYNLLDDELSASPSYINTIVNSVFSPEYEHEDLLRNKGYTPFFRSGGQGGGNQGGPRGSGQQNMSNGFNGQGGGRGGQGNQNQGGRNQQQQGGDSLNKEDLMAAMQASQEANDGGSRRRGPGTEALDEATEQAIKNMADNMGGFFGMLQRVGEEALVEYFRQHPEKLVENMTLLNTFMEGGEGQNNEQEASPQDQAIDNAIEQAQSAASSQDQSTQEPQEQKPFREPEQVGDDRDTSVQEDQNDSSGFEMDSDMMEGGGPEPEPDPDMGVNEETPMAAEPGDYDWGEEANDSDTNDSSSGSGSTGEQSQEQAEEDTQKAAAGGGGSGGDGDDEWDELFGDLED